MSNIVGGKVYVAPNGTTKVRVFRHGFVAPITDIPENIGRGIEYGSAMALEILGKKATPFEVFELMGWTQEKPKPGQGEGGA